jgi:hypothetical protein
VTSRIVSIPYSSTPTPGYVGTAFRALFCLLVSLAFRLVGHLQKSLFEQVVESEVRFPIQGSEVSEILDSEPRFSPSKG